MRRDSPIFVAGHRGLVGSALVRRLRAGGYDRLILRTRDELDLTRPDLVEAFFLAERPQYVFLAAARVGGILANDTRPADFIRENLRIQTNVIDAAYRAGVTKLLFLASSCVYPRLAPQPMKEEHLLTGPLEPTNEAYAIAKIAGLKMCAAYNRQHGCDFLCAMPANLYGPGDNYDLAASHVLPALVRKAHEAKLAGSRVLPVWGSGTPRREFLFVDDLAEACVFLMERCRAAEVGEFVNVGTGTDLTIRELAEAVMAAVGFDGELEFDPAKPDGMPRKVLDVSRMTGLGWRARTGLSEGLRQTYADYLARYARPQAAATATAEGA